MWRLLVAIATVLLWAGILTLPASAAAICSAELHDAYRVAGADGQMYPTWHPPSDPSGCSFGHEHGDDPSGSPALRGRAGPTFGYATVKAGAIENHVGYKVFRWDNVPFNPRYPSQEGANYLFTIHMGTYGAGRLTVVNHALEVHYWQPDDGRELHASLMSEFGMLQIGEGANDPSPTYQAQQGHAGLRSLASFGAFVPPAVPYEVWQSPMRVGTQLGGSWLAYTTIQAAVFNPGTYGALVDGKPALGYSQTRINTSADSLTPTSADSSPSSAYRGDHREAYLNPMWFASDPRRPVDIWTDPYGALVAQSSPPANAIRQYICQLSMQPADDSAVFGADRHNADTSTINPN